MVIKSRRPGEWHISPMKKKGKKVIGVDAPLIPSKKKK